MEGVGGLSEVRRGGVATPSKHVNTANRGFTFEARVVWPCSCSLKEEEGGWLRSSLGEEELEGCRFGLIFGANSVAGGCVSLLLEDVSGLGSSSS
jgi:hypothetical protein